MVEQNELEILQQLLRTPELFEDLRRLSASELAVQQQLRAMYAPALVRAALSVEDARRRAEGQLPCWAELWLTRTGLEQSTAWQVAEHKSARFPTGEPVLDLCSGIGVDTALLLNRGPVTSVDIDPAMMLRCATNLEVWRKSGATGAGHAWSARTVDVHEMAFGRELVHLDPDRRAGGDRPARRLEFYQPDLTWMQHLVQNARGGALKLGPASNFMQKFPACEIELISLNGECREATVWFGELAGQFSFRATSLPAGESISLDPLSAWCPLADQPEEFIFDPDPAVVRSGLLDAVGEMHSLHRLDRNDEYLTGSAVPASAFVTAYAVEACLPNRIQNIKRYLSEHPGRDYEIKCRHLKVDANALQKKLPRGDGPIRTLIHLRIAGRAHVVVARRIRNTRKTCGNPVDDSNSES